jgi:hypothetical protein
MDNTAPAVKIEQAVFTNLPTSNSVIFVSSVVTISRSPILKEVGFGPSSRRPKIGFVEGAECFVAGVSMKPYHGIEIDGGTRSPRCLVDEPDAFQRVSTGAPRSIDGYREKAGGRLTVDLSLRLPARAPVPALFR